MCALVYMHVCACACLTVAYACDVRVKCVCGVFEVIDCVWCMFVKLVLIIHRGFSVTTRTHTFAILCISKFAIQ